MRVMITGGGGFLGKALARMLLDEGFSVHIFGRTPRPQMEREGFVVKTGDLGDAAAVKEACAGMDAVFHVAAKAGVWGRWDDYFLANVIGTRHVVAACQAQSVRYLVHTSTPSVVFNRKAFQGEDERLPYGGRWLCHYAHTKAIAEEEALAAHDDETLRVCALRPHLIWGEGDPHIVPRIVASARAGRLAIVGDGLNKVDITHVTHAAHAHKLALKALQEGRAGGRAYFLSDGQPVELWSWIHGVLKALGEPPLEKRFSLKKAYNIGAVMETLWRVLPLRGEPPMTRFVAMELAKDHYFSIEAARRDLGYEPIVDTSEAMAAMLESMRA